MSLLNQDESEMFMRAMYGENAKHGAGWLVLQDAGTTESGKPIHFVMGVIVGDLRHEGAQGFRHEMEHCEIVIRPRAAYAGNKFRGAGAAALVTSDAYNPDNWDKQVI